MTTCSPALVSGPAVTKDERRRNKSVPGRRQCRAVEQWGQRPEGWVGLSVPEEAKVSKTGAL